MHQILAIPLSLHLRPGAMRFWRNSLLSAAVIALTAGAAAKANLVEFLSGAKVEGTVTKIQKAEKKITFEAVIAGRKRTRVYPYSRIRAVTYRGRAIAP